MDPFDALWRELEPIGRDATTGGYRRYAFDTAELDCREWFVATARARGLEVETDRNSNLWAWWVPAGADPSAAALVLGSHLDSVPDGGAFDGPLGVVSAFAALDAVRAAGVTPDRPVALVAFADEEGARFGIACAGSRLMTGQLDPDRARALVGRDGVTMAEAMSRAGLDPAALGPDPERVARIDRFVELHIEQGRGLVERGAAVGVAESIWPHGRYRFTFRGVADHAGTTRMRDRHDPMVAYARTALAAHAAARESDGRATFGRIEVEPNATNAVPSTVRAWLDARAADQAALDALVGRVSAGADEGAGTSGTEVELVTESTTPLLTFDVELRDRVAAALGRQRGGDTVPVLPTAAGHDAGILTSVGVPAAMLFVRNPTGISHSPDEFAEPADCHAGVDALAAVLEDLAR
ncbi:MAG: allantoate amidohydrolase [Actinomycetales bacterium]|nr:allantoate amidohydrolase [Actinomycetales bacterium]